VIPVHHEKLPAISGLMDSFVGDFDTCKAKAHIVAQCFVVVPGDIDHTGSGRRLVQDLVDHCAVAGVPVPGAGQAPAIHDVADEIEKIAVIVPEEIQQQVRLAAPRSQMDVRDPDTAMTSPPARP
jgi:hypothetical protein